MKRMMALLRREFWENKGAFRTTPLVIGGIPEEADADFIATFHLDGLGHTGRQREWAADQRIASHEAVLHVEDVHGTAAPFGGTGFLRKKFCHDLFRVRTALDGVDVIAVTGYDVVMSLF